jgi:hypothetical protein
MSSLFDVVDAWQSEVVHPAVATSESPQRKRSNSLPLPNMHLPPKIKRSARLKQQQDKDGEEEMQLTTQPRSTSSFKTLESVASESATSTVLSTRSKYATVLGAPPLLSNQFSSAASSSTSKTRASRAQSPSKKMADLLIAAKPIEITPLKSEDQMPSGFLPTLGRLINIQNRIGILPTRIKQEIKHTCSPFTRIEDSMFAKPQSSRSREQLLRELDELQEIIVASEICTAEYAPEPSWNESVHSRLLRQSLQGMQGIQYRNITTAKPKDEWVVRDIKGVNYSGKLVDYGICLNHDLISKDDIIAKLAKMPGFQQSINQAEDSQIRYTPLVISIETKTSSRWEEEAHIQLSLWISTYLLRLAALIDVEENKEEPHPLEMVPFPLIAIYSGRWEIFLARYTKLKIVSIPHLVT